MQHMREELGFSKYDDFSGFEAEKRAAERFNALKQESTENLSRSRARITVCSAIILIFAILIGTFAYISNSLSLKEIERQTQITTIRHFSLRLMNYVFKTYFAMRDVALTAYGNSEQFEDYIDMVYAEQANCEEVFSNLREAAADFPEILAMLNDLGYILDNWAQMRNVSLTYALNGQLDECLNNVTTYERAQISEITALVGNITDTATQMAGKNYANMYSHTLNRSMYAIIMTALIAVISVFIIFYSRRDLKNAMEIIEKSQHDQHAILDELVVLDEQLRQSLSNLEKEREELREIQEKYSNSLEASNDVIFEVNVSTGAFFASEKWYEVTGFPKASIYNPDYLYRYIHSDDHKKLEDILGGVYRTFHTQLRAVNADGSMRWLDARGRWLDDTRFMGSISNITKQKQSEEYVKYVAYHDIITHLPNRAYFIRRLEDALMRAKETGRPGCVFFIDLDNFKFINDGYGHDFGDKLLRAVAEKLSKAFSGDTVIARFGGDEFLMLLSDIDSEIVNAYIQKVMEIFNDEILVEDAPFFITASVGASIFPEDGTDVNQLLKNSDAAMYESKYAGRNTFAFYDKTMSDKVMRKASITDVLRSAANDGSLYMVFQPQVNPTNGKVEGFEALMRLHDKSLGVITPAEFIPVAEESRLIVPLGYWALRKAIEADIELRRQGLKHKNISVNVSEIQLREQDFISNIKKIIDEYHFDPSRLHIEITESSLLSNLEEKTKIFDELREAGMKIELDDFGTGYSSLNYVRMIHLDVLKIDKCFIDEIGESAEKEELIDLIVRLARTFNASIIAEGVETQKQLEFIKSKGGIIVQGYYYSKPLELNDIKKKVDDLERVHRIKD